MATYEEKNITLVVQLLQLSLLTMLRLVVYLMEDLPLETSHNTLT